MVFSFLHFFLPKILLKIKLELIGPTICIKGKEIANQRNQLNYENIQTKLYFIHFMPTPAHTQVLTQEECRGVILQYLLLLKSL